METCQQAVAWSEPSRVSSLKRNQLNGNSPHIDDPTSIELSLFTEEKPIEWKLDQTLYY